MLRTLIGLIQATLTATLAAQSPPIAPPVYRFGLDQLAIEDAPHRICWVPKRGPADGNIIHAADFPPTFGQAAPGVAFPTPGPLWRRKLLVEAHVWDVRANPQTDPDTSKDYDVTEALSNHLVAAIHEVTFGSYAMASEDWTTVQGSAQRLGIVNVLGIVMYLPWTRERDATAQVLTIPIVPEGT
jgi:hypothetical protein